MKPSSDIVTLKNTFPAISAPSLPARSPAQSWSRRRSRPAARGPLPGDLGDVGRQVAQRLLAALDRVVLLHGLVGRRRLRPRFLPCPCHRSFLLPCLLEVLHVGVQPVETLVPEPLESADPLVDR